MKIAVVHNLPLGGAKRAMRDWLIGLSLRGHVLDLFSYTHENKKDEVLDPILNRHLSFGELPLASGNGAISKLIYLKKIKTISKKIAKKINKDGYDVAFIHQCMFLQNPLVLRYLKIPKVFYSQDPPQRNLYEPGLAGKVGLKRFQSAELLKDFLNTKTIQSASVVLTSSYYTRESLKKIYGVDAIVVYYGIDKKIFYPDSSVKKDYVLSVGRLHFTKGHEFIIKSLGTVSPALRPRLKIVCESKNEGYMGRLRSLANECNVRLEFEPAINDAQLRKLYSEAVLTLCGYIMEPLGFVPLESLACGTAVVGVREAGMRESILEGQVGLLANRDPADMGRAVESLFQNAALRRQFEHNAMEYIEKKWSLEESIKNIESSLLKAQ